MRRSALAIALTGIALSVPLGTSALVLPEDDGPQGLRALENIATYAMVYPSRWQGSPTMELARDDLAVRLAAIGLDVERHAYGDWTGGVNILGILPGTTRPHDWVVVSAHYDVAMVPNHGLGAALHGAWDDGSGVAAVLEIARVAAQREWNHTIVFAFFDGEEPGLVGSRAFVRDHDAKAWEGGNVRLIANLNMDPPGLNWPCVARSGAVMPVVFMQGRSGTPGSTILRKLAYDAALLDQSVPPEAIAFYNVDFPIGGVLWGTSDNLAFAQRGIPDLYVGSAAHLRIGDTTYQPLYPLHTPADTLATLAAFCVGGPTVLAEALQVEMRIVWRTMIGVDAVDGFPTP